MPCPHSGHRETSFSGSRDFLHQNGEVILQGIFPGISHRLQTTLRPTFFLTCFIKQLLEKSSEVMLNIHNDVSF